MTQCACGSHNTDVVIQWCEYGYKDHVQTVERRYTECWDCGLEFQTAKQINEYASQIFKAKSASDFWIFCQHEKQFKRRLNNTREP